MYKTLISEKYRTDFDLLHEALNNNGATSGIEHKTLFSLLQEEKSNNLALALTLAKELRQEKDAFPTYGEMFAYPAFIQEVIAFAKECILYDIKTSDLPAKTLAQQELVAIVSKALALPLSEKVYTKDVEEKLEALTKRDDIAIVPAFYKDIYHARIKEKLSAKISVIENKELGQKDLWRAESLRQEIEAVIQEICSHGQRSNIILCDHSSQLPVVMEVLARYDIPYCAYGVKLENIVINKYTALVEAAIYKDHDHLFKAAVLDAFSVPYPKDALEYLDIMLANDNAEELIAKYKDDEVYGNNVLAYKGQENAYQDWLAKVDNELAAITSCTSGVQALRVAYDLISHNPILKEAKALKEGFRLRKQLETLLPLVETDADALFILEGLNNMTTTTNIVMSDMVTVSDLSHPISPAEHSYVIGCSASSYPGFISKSGLFDEEYVKEIKKYPSLAQRLDSYTKQLAWIDHSAKYIHYSCPQSDSEGREVQLAFEVEEMFKGIKASKRDVVRMEASAKSDHYITPACAQELYLDEKSEITGSISTIERWFNCPFSWFIESGLKVREKQLTGLDNASIGTLQHAVMEHFVRDLGKDYGRVSEEDIKAYLKPRFDILRKLNPKEQMLCDITEERMAISLYKTFQFLGEYEKYNSFTPYQEEHKFGMESEEHISEHVKLRGVIDRVDTCHDLVRVIDYKSSTHKLNAGKFAAGLQLQLISYLVIATRATGLTPAAALYYSFKEEKATIDSLVTNGRRGKNKEILPVDVLNETIIANASRDSKQLYGWNFVDRLTELDSSSKFISWGRKSNIPYDFEGIAMMLEEIYEYFYENIAAGNIKLDPVEGACTFCKFKAICQFRGEERKVKPVLSKEEEADGNA